MLIFYADECGDHSMLTSPTDSAILKPGVSETFVLSAVGIRDSSRKPLAEALFELKLRHFGSASADLPWADTEIKGRYLFRASRSVATGNVLENPVGYRGIGTVEQVDSLVSDLGLLFAKYRPLVFAAAIDKRELLRRGLDHSPLGVAYAYIHQRIALAMEKLYAGDAAIIVADQQTQHETFFRSGKMNEVRERITGPLRIKPNFNLVLDKPLWVDTDLSSWDREIIQLADIVAYTVAESVKRGQAPAERWYLWDRIAPCLAIHWSNGGILGGGLAIHPKTARQPKL